MTAALLIALCGHGARGGDAEAPAAAVAAGASRAAAEGRTEDLARLAAREHPDPWLVTDALLAAGDVDGARAFAAAAPRPAVDGLPRYVEEAAPEAELGAARSTLPVAREAYDQGEAEEALGLLGDGSAPPPGVVGVRHAMLRGRALLELSRYARSAAAFEDAAGRARALGWRAGESQGLYYAGLAYERASEFDRVLETYGRRLEVEKALASEMGVGRTHFGLATTYYGLGLYEEEARHLELARAAATATGDHEYLAKVLSNEALRLSREGDADASIRTARRALEELNRIDPSALATRFQPDPRRVARSRSGILLNLASWSAMQGDIAAARDHGDQAVLAAQACESPALVARTRATLATLEGVWHELHDEYLDALERYDEASRHHEETRDRLLVADTLRRISAVQNRLGDYPDALANIEQAVTELRGLDARRELSRAEYHAGSIATRLARFHQAEVHYEEALNLARGMDDRRHEADVLTGIASLYYARADYARAMEAVREALQVQEEVGGLSRRGVLRLLQARIRREVGDLEGADRHLREAAADFEAVDDAHNLQIARDHLVVVLMRRGEIEEAEAQVARNLEAQRRAANRPGIASALSRLAGIRFLQERYEDAVTLRAEVVDLYDSMGDWTRVVESRIQLGRERYWSGDKDRALAELTESYAAALDLGVTRVLAWSAIGLAEVNLFAGRHDEAVRWAHHGLGITSEMGLDLVEEETAGLRTRFAPLHEIGAMAAMRTGSVEDLYQFMEEGRAATLLAALGGRDALREATIPAALRREEEAARGAEAMANARLEHARDRGRRREVALRQKDLAKAHTRVQDVVARIQREARLQADLGYTSVRPLSAVQADLAPEEALVMYAEVHDEAVALVVTPEEVRPVHLGYQRDLHASVAALRQDEGKVALDADAVAAARGRLLESLRLPAAAKRLLISPGGTVAYLPYALLAPEHDVVFVPSATTYGVLRAQRGGEGGKVLAFGDPDYLGQHGAIAALDAGHPVLRGERLTALPGTREEAQSVGDVVLLGSAASETRFRRTVEKDGPWRAVHLACHGLVDPQRPTLSSLALTADAENDGLVTALDVFRLQVPAELVVLSGCETGRGRLYAGEGLLGLARAFMYAGAPRVLVSLWKVDDEATRVLMTRFYELWNPPDGSEGLDAATALRKAQEHVRGHAQWAHPFYWAAWVLWGLPD